jgi:hypothetical protein
VIILEQYIELLPFLGVDQWLSMMIRGFLELGAPVLLNIPPRIFALLFLFDLHRVHMCETDLLVKGVLLASS